MSHLIEYALWRSFETVQITRPFRTFCEESLIPYPASHSDRVRSRCRQKDVEAALGALTAELRSDVADAKRSEEASPRGRVDLGSFCTDSQRGTKWISLRLRALEREKDRLHSRKQFLQRVSLGLFQRCIEND